MLPLPILALHRYWIWADFHKESMLARREKLAASDGLERAGHAFDALTALSFFYASLFVVIEGWRKLGLADEEIDDYLASDNTDLLRRFHNGVFHFQANFDDQRFMGFLDDAENPVDWARSLHSACARWFDDWGRQTIGYGPRDIAEWMKAERRRRARGRRHGVRESQLVYPRRSGDFCATFLCVAPDGYATSDSGRARPLADARS